MYNKGYIIVTGGSQTGSESGQTGKSTSTTTDNPHDSSSGNPSAQSTLSRQSSDSYQEGESKALKGSKCRLQPWSYAGVIRALGFCFV